MSRRDRASVDGRPPSDPGRPVVTALLPVRFFFGATFLYAGLDKLLDPHFFDPASPASIMSQMVAFARVSPIAPLVRIGEPLAVPIGLGIALLEITIGLGALTGLAFRAAAAAGAVLSLLFFLTASWATRPYYFGADLPYAVGWLSLAIAGHGGLLVPRRLLDWASNLGGLGGAGAAEVRSAAGSRRRTRRPASVTDPAGPPLRDRRTVLQAGVLGGLALVVASLAVPFRRAGAGTGGSSDGAGASTDPGAGGTPSASPSAAAPSGAAAGLAVAHIADLAKTGARAFTIPFTAPAPFPAGDPGVIVQLQNGSFVAFDAVCTHAGCTVQWDRAERLLFCPCHGAAFDPARDAAVVGDGPTNQPLAAIPIVVDPASGVISLSA